MKEKEKKGAVLKWMLFTYLAVSKVFYWFHNIASMAEVDFTGLGVFLLNRILGQDIMIIAGVVFFYFLDKFHQSFLLKTIKYNAILGALIFWGIGYVALIALFYIYWSILSLFFHDVSTPPLGLVIINGIGFYVVLAIVLEVKEYLKKKEKETYLDTSTVPITDHGAYKLTLLKEMLDDGVLTQAEFEQKKNIIVKAGEFS